jgi:hypothetical protein
MMKNLFLLIFAILCIALATSCRKTEACVEVIDNPEKDEQTEISARCSKNARWVDYYVDGQYIDGGFNSSSFYYRFPALGKHTVKIITFSKYNGTTNSQSGTCSGCSGAGKSSSIEKEVNVVP